MIHGLPFKIEVLKSLETLTNQETRAYTVSEVFSFLLKKNQLKPDDSYKKSFRKRTWAVLKEWCEVGYISSYEEKHPITKTKVGYYKYHGQQQQIASSEG